jgi:DNA-binding NarL/FixJ family response regulator
MTSRDLVLVVDDMPGSLSMLTDALETEGITVLVAMDAGQAIASVEKITPDVILMDAVMPDVDGFETCRQIKTLPSMGEVPVIFMTGLSRTEDVVRGFEAGGVDYITKPVVAQELLARIRVHLANARMTRSARMALDATGRYLLAVDGSGGLRWATPQANERLNLAFPQRGEGEALPTAVETVLRRIVQEGRDADSRMVVLPGTRDGVQLRAAYVGQVGPHEYLLRLCEGVAARDEDVLRQRLGLTARESEVLLWLAHGKANRDIAAILDLSPRTVDKHLEQIYGKLGVENRTSAAACAMRALGEH